MSGSSSPQSPEVARLLEEARRLRPWTDPQRARAWNGLVERATTRPRRNAWAYVLGATVATAVAFVGFALVRAAEHSPSPAPAPIVAPVAAESLRALEGAQYRASQDASGRRVELTSGVVELGGGEPDARRWKVQTPHLLVSAPFGSQVRVASSAAYTEVTVGAGAVRVELAEGRFAVLFAGESLRSDRLDSVFAEAPARSLPALAPRVKASDAMSRTRCGRESGAAGTQRDCLTREAKGGDLAAENALFALALLTREEQGAAAALPHFEAYARRFEHGVFAPEVQLAIAEAHLATGHALAAEAALLTFLGKFPDDPRRAQVKTALRDEAFSKSRP